MFECYQLKTLAASKSAKLEDMGKTVAALEARLAEEEEGRRNAHVSVMRLEAQVTSRTIIIHVPLNLPC